MKKALFISIVLFLWIGNSWGQVTVSNAVSGNGTYTTLTGVGGAFAAINGAAQTNANIVITISANTTEDGANSLNENTWTSLKIYPTASGVTLSGTVAKPLINFNGADNVTIDGRVNATGSIIDLTITNLSTSAVDSTSTIQFVRDASNNTVQYCNVQGSETSALSGIIFVSVGKSTGNMNDKIDYCNITCAGTNRPTNAIYSNGSAIGNVNITISNNSIYNFFSTIAASNGINFSSTTHNSTISNNKFFENTAFAVVDPGNSEIRKYRVIRTYDSHNNTISNNQIAGTDAAGAGTWTKTGYDCQLYGIDAMGDANTNYINANTIKSISWYGGTANNINAFYGINTDGLDTIKNNIIGSSTATGSITITSTWNANYGIYSGAGSTINGNNIGGITVATPVNTVSNDFYAIYLNNPTSVAGVTNYVVNNLIGSTTVANSLYCSSTINNATQKLVGVYVNDVNNTTYISSNTINNLYNRGTFFDWLGYQCYEGTTNAVVAYSKCYISKNVISNLKGWFLNAIFYNNANQPVFIDGNQISNLVFNNATSSIEGINIDRTANSTLGIWSEVSNNFLDINNTGNGDNLLGIIFQGGSSYAKVFNNIININTASPGSNIGIGDGANLANSTINVYHNTVYIGGKPASGLGSLYRSACYTKLSNNPLSNVKNNIFVMARNNIYDKNLVFDINSNTGSFPSGIVNNNCYYIAHPSALTYFARFLNGDFATPPLPNGNDANSLLTNPFFVTGNPSVINDFKSIETSLLGTPLADVTTDINGLTRSATTPVMGAIEGFNTSIPVSLYSGGVLKEIYKTLKLSFDAINNGDYTGALELKVGDNTVETATASLNASGTGSASYSSIKIYPSVSGLKVSGNLAAPIVNLNGADNVTFDGRVNATGSTPDLTIENTNTSNTAGTSAITFLSGATYDTVKYCNVKGSETSTVSGVVMFSATAASNSNLILSNNNISCAGTNRPISAVYFKGAPPNTNSAIAVRENNFFNFFNPSVSSFGVVMSTQSSSCEISSNSFYETTNFNSLASVEYNMIFISIGNDHSISSNYFGGNAPQCAGVWNKVSNAYGNKLNVIRMNLATSTGITISGNTIKGFDWTNNTAVSFTGISLACPATVLSNTIGSLTETETIKFKNNITSITAGFFGISSVTGSTISGNNIGGIVTNNALTTGATHFYGIDLSNTLTNSTTISNNTIGGTVAESIKCASTSTANAQYSYGINSSSAYPVNITNNVVQNVCNYSTAVAGSNHGISASASSAYTIIGNTISTLASNNPRTNSLQTVSVAGIMVNSNAGIHAVKQNTISNLVNTNLTNGIVIGIYLSGGTGGTNEISKNSIDLRTHSGKGDIYGIKLYTGVSLVANNVINIQKENTQNHIIYGIWDPGTSGNNLNVYYNTVSIGGTSTGNAQSFCYYMASDVNTVDIKNNVFHNSRSASAAGNYHLAIYEAASNHVFLSMDYNSYYASGVGGVLGGFGGTYDNTLPWLPFNDSHSLESDPQLTSSSNLKPQGNSPLIGIALPLTAVTTDILDSIRHATSPTIGAYEMPILTTWTGITSTDWNTVSNWSSGIPTTNMSVVIGTAPNNPQLSTMATVKDLTLNSGTVLSISANGHLTVSNTLTNNAGTSGLVIKSDGTGTGTLISNSSGVQGKVQRILSCSKWHLISSPVSNAVSGMFMGNYLKYYNEATGGYVGINLTTIPLIPGKGYLYWNTGTGYATKEYSSGTLNTGNISFSYTKTADGWNLSGNPYPSVLDWDVVSPTLPATVNGGVSMYDPITNTYKYYIMGGGAANTATQYVSPGQGFFVQATGSGTMTFTDAMRTHNGTPPFYKSASADQMLLLKISGNNITTQTAVRFGADATTGIDRLLDMCKIMEPTPQVPMLYTVCEGQKMVLNTLPLLYIKEGAIIPVYFEAGVGGSYQIEASEMGSIDPTTSIYLEDVSRSYTQDLRLKPTYNFDYSTQGQARKILIHFKNRKTGVDETGTIADGVQCYTSDNQLYVNFTPEVFGTKEGKANIEVYTLTGQQIYSRQTGSLANQIELSTVAGAIYIVKVTYGNQVYVKKIIL